MEWSVMGGEREEVHCRGEKREGGKRGSESTGRCRWDLTLLIALDYGRLQHFQSGFGCSRRSEGRLLPKDNVQLLLSTVLRSSTRPIEARYSTMGRYGCAARSACDVPRRPFVLLCGSVGLPASSPMPHPPIALAAPFVLRLTLGETSFQAEHHLFETAT